MFMKIARIDRYCIALGVFMLLYSGVSLAIAAETHTFEAESAKRIGEAIKVNDCGALGKSSV